MRELSEKEYSFFFGGALVSDEFWGDFDWEGSTIIRGYLGGQVMDGNRGIIMGLLIGSASGSMAAIKLAVAGGFVGGFIAEVVGAIYGGLVGGLGGAALGGLLGTEMVFSYYWKYLNTALGGNI